MARSWLIIFFERFSEAPAFYHINSLFLSFLLLALKKRCPGLPLLIRIMAGFHSISGCFKPMLGHPYPPKFSKGHPTSPPGSRLYSYFLLTHVRLADHVKNPYLDPCKHSKFNLMCDNVMNHCFEKIWRKGENAFHCRLSLMSQMCFHIWVTPNKINN